VEFTKKVLAQDRVRLIGVCFGHQIIGRAMDVKVARSDRGWEVSVTPVQLTEKGQQLFGVKELVSSPLQDSVNTMLMMPS
jgi:GMP synthase-like glutamine amidotransferase